MCKIQMSRYTQINLVYVFCLFFCFHLGNLQYVLKCFKLKYSYKNSYIRTEVTNRKIYFGHKQKFEH
jgi:hypothetical protein